MKDGQFDNFYLQTFVIIVIATLLTLYGINYLPFILIFFPLIFIANIIKDGLSQGLTNMIITITIIAFITSINIGLVLAIIFIPFTIVISSLIKKRQSNNKILGLSTISLFISILAILFLIRILGIDIVKYVENSAKEAISIQLEMLENMGLSNYDFFNQKQLLQDTFKYLLLIIPSIVLILSAFVSYINYLLSGIILDKLGIRIVNIPKFSKFTLPNNILAGILTMMIVTFVSSKLGFSYYQTVLVNIGVLITFGFFVQGLSVVDYLLNKLKFNIIFKIIFFVTFIINQALISVIILIGIIDLIFDFRKLRVRKRFQ